MGFCGCSLSDGDGTLAGDIEPVSIDSKDHILGIAPISEIFADGLKVTAVAIEYDESIDSATLSASDFTVKTEVAGQTITRAYTNTAPEKTANGVEGPFVILELSQGDATPVAPEELEGLQAITPMGDGVKPQPIEQIGNISWDPAAHPATLLSSAHGGDGKVVYISQVGDIDTTGGDIYYAFSDPNELVDNYWCLNPILDTILKPDYSDETYGRVKYNISFPENYDETKTYPAIVFLTDEDSAAGKHADVLTSGLGGVIWSDPVEQAKNECIVIVPAFQGAIVNGDYESVKNIRGNTASNSYLGILNLMDYLMEKVPNIDEDRVYVTGQGSGARAAIKMMIDRPYMFAASLLFAPDYDPAEMTKLTEANMWIVVSEGDDAALASMDACIDAIEAKGEAVSKTTWDGKASDEEFAAYVDDMLSERNNINYAVFQAGTLVQDGLTDDSAQNHVDTWRKGYSIEGLRDWLFKHKKTDDRHVDHVTTITQIFKDGQKPSAVAIEYDKVISNDSLDADWNPDFEVVLSEPWQAAVEENIGIVDIDVHVTNVYANTVPEMASEGVDGKYVIIELSADYELPIQTAMSINSVTDIGVVQVGEIAATDGEIIAPDDKVLVNDKVSRLVVDDFKPLYYTDADTGNTLMYNLYVPENYDETKSYPMVMFVHDASAVNTEISTTLTNCYGATIWATPADQAKHECFVLAPQYSTVTVTNESEYSEVLPMTMRLVAQLLTEYNIDPGRVYTTGQSMGCMMSLAMMIEDHDLFAKALLVAGQWDAEKTRPLYDKELWIAVSQGDLKAYPGMNASVAVWEEEGATVSKAIWSGQSTVEDFTAYTDAMMKEGNDIKYTAFEAGTVVPEGQDDGGGNNHMYSMRIAYGIDALRDWLLAE